MYDDSTVKLHLPLPHPANDLSTDVLRLRGALTALDAAVGCLDGMARDNSKAVAGLMGDIASESSTREAADMAQVQALCARTQELRAEIDAAGTALTTAYRAHMHEVVAAISRTIDGGAPGSVYFQARSIDGGRP